MIEYESSYYQVCFDMPGYTDSYKVYGWDMALEKYNFCLSEHKKDENYYKNVRIDIISEVRSRINIVK